MNPPDFFRFRPHDPLRLARLLAGFSLVATGLSISLSQIGMALSSLCALVLFLRHRQAVQATEQATTRPPFFTLFPGPFGLLLLIGLLLFTWLGIVALYDRLTTGALANRPGELFDGALFLYAPVFFLIARAAPRGDRLLARALEILIWVLLLGGVVAVFSEFRLARMIMGFGLEGSAANRPQHLLYVFDWPGTLSGLALYRPVGFMNTRLTFAGLLILLLPFIVGRNLVEFGRAYSQRTLDRSFWMRSAQSCIALGLLGLNGTRSALLGALVGLLFSLPLFASIWLPRKDAGILRHKRSILAGIMTVLLLAGGGAWFARSTPTFAKVTGTFARHTDFQRQIIWAGAGDIIARRPLTGAGPGRFREASLDWRRTFLRDQPHTLYWVQLTPSGHAHNDLLHLSATGGLPAGLLFLALAACCLGAAFYRPVSRHASIRMSVDSLLFSGTAAFFVAGLFQCYFQDDEVVALFWMLMALAGARTVATEEVPIDATEAAPIDRPGI